MKIAIIGSRGIPARYGGFETFAEELSVRLVDHGVDVTVFCEGVAGPSEYKGVHLEYVPTPHLGGLTTLLHDFRALWRARKSYDLVYMLGYGTSIFCTVPKISGTPVWMNMDGVEWQREKWGLIGKSWWKTMESIAQRVPDLMVCDARGIQSFITSRHRKNPPNVVIPYGANVVEDPPDPQLLQEWGLEPDKYHLIVSRLEPENHVVELFQGFHNSNSPYPLVALGTTRKPNSYTRSLEQIASGDDRIILPGPIYDDRIKSLRYYARTYLHGHSVGGTNPSLLEAMGNGNAVIAHDNIFNREVASESALYFKDNEEVSGLLDMLDGDDEKRNELGLSARKRVKECYSWELITEKYLEMLRSLESFD